MLSVRNNRLNPNPITKLFVVGLLGLTVVNSIHPYFEWVAVFVISIMYYINGFKKDAVKNIAVFTILFFVPNFEFLYHLPFIVKIAFSLLFVLRMFYIPFSA